MIKLFREIQIRNKIKSQFNQYLESLTNSQSENSINQQPLINEIYIREFGFCLIIHLPNGYDYSKFRNLLPSLELLYKGEIYAELTENKSVYLKCHLNGLNISDLDKIKFKWYRHFSNSKSRNAYGDTYKITKTKQIKNPNNDKEIVGYRLFVHINEGLKFEELQKEEDALSKILGKTFIEWNKDYNCAEIEVITKLLDNKEPFRMVKCNPWELYVATSYSYKNILLDFKYSANVIFGGINGSGKTVSEIGSILNLTKQHNRDILRLYVSFESFKSDLRILSHLPQCEYYGTSIDESLRLMRFLLKEAKRRNKLFEQCTKFTTNVFDYNKTHKNKLPYSYFISDEITEFNTKPHDNDIVKKKKEEFISLFDELGRTGRSAGVWIIVATQRASKDNLTPALKSQLNCVVCGKQVNVSSALTLFGNGEQNASRVTRLDKKNREFLIENQDGISLGKILYFTNGMMEEFVKDIIIKEPNYINLDKQGNIIKIEPKTEEITEKSIENQENKQKTNKNKVKSTKNNENVEWDNKKNRRKTS
jgi:hypothetical protein